MRGNNGWAQAVILGCGGGLPDGFPRRPKWRTTAGQSASAPGVFHDIAMSDIPSSITASARWVLGLAALVGLILLALAFRPAPHVYDMPMTEDGYYALSVARNVAAGNGITIDGANLTNGFQPLFTFLQAGAFVLASGDEILAMRLVMALGWLFHIGIAILVAAIVRDAWPAVHGQPEKTLRAALAAFLCLAAPLMLNHAYNGLETGCVTFFYAAIARWMQLGRDRSWAGLAALGGLVGLLVLARIDAAFLAVALGLNELRRSWARGLATMLGRGAVIGLAALIVSLPWWAYNTIYFGSPMPTSGTAQQAWALEWLRLEHAEWALRLVLFPWLFAGAHEGAIGINVPIPAEPGYMTMTLTGFLRTAVLTVIAVVLRRVARSGALHQELETALAEEQARVRRLCEFAVCFGLAFAALFVYYALSFIAYWFYYRYFAPLALIAFVVVPTVVARWQAGRWRSPLAALVLALIAVQISVLAGLAMVGKGLGGNTVYHDQVALLRQFVPAEDLVAAGQSGTLGFFRSHVVNTDGKVNREALAYQERMWDYLRQRNIRWFVDWPYYVNKYLGVPLDAEGQPDAEGNGWRLVAERNYFYLYEYSGPTGR